MYLATTNRATNPALERGLRITAPTAEGDAEEDTLFNAGLEGKKSEEKPDSPVKGL